MTSRQYKAAIEALGLSQGAAGRMLGISPRQAQRFASGESPIPSPVEKLLNLMLAVQENLVTKTAASLFEQAGVAS